MTSGVVGELLASLAEDGEREARYDGRRVVFEREGVPYAWWVVTESELREAVRRAGPGARAAFGHRGADGMSFVLQWVYTALEVEREPGNLPGEWTFSLSEPGG